LKRCWKIGLTKPHQVQEVQAGNSHSDGIIYGNPTNHWLEEEIMAAISLVGRILIITIFLLSRLIHVYSAQDGYVESVGPHAAGQGGPEEVVFRSIDGREFYGYLVKPSGKGPFPAVLWIHGGGGEHGKATVHALDHPYVQRLVQEGYAVFAVDYRWELGGLDVDDVLAGAQHLASLPDIDKQRIVYAGGSGGAYLALMAATRSHPAAVVEVSGPTHILSFLLFLQRASYPQRASMHAANGPLERVSKQYGGLPPKVVEPFNKISPIYLADRITAPVLIQHGDADEAVPVEHAYLLRDALLRSGKTVECIIYPGVGHGSQVWPFFNFAVGAVQVGWSQWPNTLAPWVRGILQMNLGATRVHSGEDLRETVQKQLEDYIHRAAAMQERMLDDMVQFLKKHVKRSQP
jgi:acetyl esterase/lipase